MARITSAPLQSQSEALQPEFQEDEHPSKFTDQDYAQVANFRATLRQLVRQTELEAQKVGLTPQHYHLMLAIKGFPGRDWANISELAERLQIRHNATIGLIKRAVARGLVARRQGTDRRTVRVTLTPEGERVLSVLIVALRSERQRVRAAVEQMADDEVESPSTLPDREISERSMA